ncbi:MAG TPA: AAA family ATPase [Hymenobacter sp.]|jgi:predicted ATPase
MSEASDQFRLTRLRVKNFRSIGDVDIEFGPLTVLIGPNGAGKSNVVDALRFVRDIVTKGLKQAIIDRGGFNQVVNWHNETINVEFYLSIKRFEFVYSMKICDFDINKDFVIGEMFLIKEDNNSLLSIYKKLNSVVFEVFENIVQSQVEKIGLTNNDLFLPWNLYRLILNSVYFDSLRLKGDKNKFYFERKLIEVFTNEIRAMQDYIKEIQMFTFNLLDLRHPQKLLKESPLLDTGQNLAAVLRKIRNSDEETVREVQHVLGQLVEGVVDFSIISAGSYLVTQLHYQQPDGSIRISDLGQESDGTIRMLAMLAAVYQQPPQPLLVLEEPEANIHPGALAILAGIFDQASQRSQIILTTHSPDMLDQLPIESFRVVEKVEGETKVGPVRDEQKEAAQRRLFTPGELMRNEGLQRQPDEANA